MRWAIAGVCLGLAYLTKSPTLLICISIVVAGLWYARLKFLLSPNLWFLLLTAILVSSPLLVRNIRGFGTPLYEGVNSNITWLDNWAEIGGERSILYYDRYGIVTVERNGLPTAREFLNEHTSAQIARRVLKGAFNEITKVAPSALRPAVPTPSPLSTAWGFVVLAFAAGGWWLRRRSWEATLVFFWSGSFLVFFGWDRMFPDIRYLAPLVPIWIAFAAYGLWSLMLRLMTVHAAWRAQVVAVSGAVAMVAGWALASGALTQPQPIVAVSPAYGRLLDWLNSTIEPGDRILLGPTKDFYGLLWMVSKPVSVVLTPDVESLEGYQRYLHERNVRYVVISQESALGAKGALVPYFSVTPLGGIVENKPLPGWRAVAEDTGQPRRFVIVEAEDAARNAALRPNPDSDVIRRAEQN